MTCTKEKGQNKKKKNKLKIWRDNNASHVAMLDVCAGTDTVVFHTIQYIAVHESMTKHTQVQL